jgi:hypothetical protein
MSTPTFAVVLFKFEDTEEFRSLAGRTKAD